MSDCCKSQEAAISCCAKPKKTFTSVSASVTVKDNFKDLLCRLSNHTRMNNKVKPGLYTIGNPTEESPVLISCNYGMSFNKLRSVLRGRDVWIVVLDTKGINVWCAAGKGSFGTRELIYRISEINLSSFVSHKKIIVPQLGASGVASHLVLKETGFRIIFGPVDVKDLPEFLDNNFIATTEMRKVNFSFFDRFVLVPMELIPSLKKLLIFLIAAAILFGFTKSGILFYNAFCGALPFIIAGFIALVCGTILTPVFLPCIPFRSFAVKGFISGIVGAIATIFLTNIFVKHDHLLFFIFAIAIPTWSSYLALLFTGSTTFTNPSGVKKELKTALPLYITAGIICLLLFSLYILRFWRIV